jgi:hypothetical protein
MEAVGIDNVLNTVIEKKRNVQKEMVSKHEKTLHEPNQN